MPLVEESVELMRDEGLPAIWAKAGMFLAIVQLVQSGELHAAAEWARRGAACAHLAMGTDSAVYRKFAGLLGE